MNQGFTLIELLVVVLIIGVLSAIALPQYQTAVERSRSTEALTQMSAIREAAERYHSQHESWPASFNKLDVDIPANSNCTSGYGGKNFCLSFFTTGCPGNFCIEATRSRASHAYKLTTQVTENTNGTYSATRQCAKTSNSDDEEADSYCYAITGGNSTF